jgi:hypothetical protein
MVTQAGQAKRALSRTRAGPRRPARGGARRLIPVCDCGAEGQGGKVVLTGSFDSRWALVRLDASGRPDPSFGTAGVAMTAAAQSLYCGPSALQANGKIVLSGGELVPPSFRRVAIARYAQTAPSTRASQEARSSRQWVRASTRTSARWPFSLTARSI